MVPALHVSPGSTGNRFLDTLSTESFSRMLPKLQETMMSVGHVIAHPGMPIEWVVFPRGSVISAVTRMRDGADVEVTVFGREGFYGLQVALGDGMGSNEAMVQIGGRAYGIRSADFLECIREDADLKQRVLRYTQAIIETISQFSGCNRLHPINERCARWLLMAHDRVDGDEIFLTHEFLATMLGVRRPGVSLAAAALDKAGLIEYHRGHIIVRNRAGLEAIACECYDAANDALDRLLGYDVRKRAPTAAPLRSVR
jgi:CRP-like cAMP-binding protein